VVVVVVVVVMVVVVVVVIVVGGEGFLRCEDIMYRQSQMEGHFVAHTS